MGRGGAAEVSATIDEATIAGAVTAAAAELGGTMATITLEGCEVPIGIGAEAAAAAHVP